MIEKVNFDDYASQYESLLENQLSFFAKDRDYFSQYKIQIVGNAIEGKTPERVLDFGCGIGLSLPHLVSHFPHSKIYATDISQTSLDYVQEKNEEVCAIRDADLDAYRFDLIFVAGVFHHILPEERKNVVARLHRILDRNGSLFLFEHNPLNPVTRRMVSTCAFDVDAQMLRLGDAKSLFSDYFNVEGHGFCLYFPEYLKRFRNLERFLKGIPLGGQYYLHLIKS